MNKLLNRKTLIACTMLITSVVLGSYTFTKIPLGAIANTAEDIGTGVFWCLLLLLILMTGFHLARWVLMCGTVVPSLQKQTLTYNLLLGIFLNQTLPLGGDAARVAHLTFQKVPFSQSMICLLFDKLFALFALFFIAFTAFFLQHIFAPSSLLARYTEHLVLPLIFAIVLGVLLLLAVFFFSASLRQFLSQYPNAIAAFFVRLTLSLDILTQNTARIFLCFFLAIGVQFFNCSIALFVIFFAGWSLEPFSLFSTVAFILILAYLPISLAGWGVRETGFILIAPYVGIADAQALVVALIMGSSQLVQGLTCGAFILLPSLKVLGNDSSH